MIKEVYISQVNELTTQDQTQKDVLNFVESGWNACEVDISRFKNIMSARTSFCGCIRRNNVNGITIKQANERLFLIRDIPIKTI